MNKNKKLCILVLAAALAIVTTGCGLGTGLDYTQLGGDVQPSGEAAETGQPAQESGNDPLRIQPETSVAQQPTPGSASGTQAIYKPIIDAYIKAQSGGFTSFDPILSDTFLTTLSSPTSPGIGMELSELSLYYAFHDMNEDAVPELFIIGADPYGSHIWGVYTIAGGEPRSLLQQASAHEEITLNINRDGWSVLIHEWSHMGEVTTLFYTLPEGSNRLGIEAGLYTDWNEAARNEEYMNLDNSEIVKYGDHYEGASSLYPDKADLVPISMSEWEAAWARCSGREFVFPEMRPLSDYPS